MAQTERRGPSAGATVLIVTLVVVTSALSALMTYVLLLRGHADPLATYKQLTDHQGNDVFIMIFAPLVAGLLASGFILWWDHPHAANAQSN